MLDRCNNPRNSRYKDYGGRGIKVCRRWHAFELFLRDMGKRPPGRSKQGWRPKYTIERKNVNGNYTPRNCCWATYRQQQHNRRKDKKS